MQRRAFLAALPVLAAAPAARAESNELEVAPFITTPDEVVERMLRLAGVGANDYLVDLGSGDGRIVIAAARLFGARGLGVDIDARLVARSIESARAAGVADRVEFQVRDVFKTDLSRATVVTIYLLPSLLRRLQPKLLDELAPGARVVTHAFAWDGWAPDRAETVKLTRRHPGQGDESRILLWVVPAQVRGRWRSADGMPDWRLVVHQNFQVILVEGMAGGEPLAVSEARLSGAGLVVAGELARAGARLPFRYEGRVLRERIEGELVLAGARSSLAFVRA